MTLPAPVEVPKLIVFAGLPGTGKTTLSRDLACRMSAVLLRIDAIEQAIRTAGIPDVGVAGYGVAQAVAEANLRHGPCVVADCVNPVEASREGWRSVAARAAATLVQIELVCSNRDEHRRRVETRTGDIPDLRLPSWDDVTSRRLDRWIGERLTVDTLAPPADLLRQIETYVAVRAADTALRHKSDKAASLVR